MYAGIAQPLTDLHPGRTSASAMIWRFVSDMTVDEVIDELVWLALKRLELNAPASYRQMTDVGLVELI